MNIAHLYVSLDAGSNAVEIIEATPSGQVLRQRRVYQDLSAAIDEYASDLAHLSDLRSIARQYRSEVVS